MKLQLDAKSVVILSLIGFCIFFFSIWYFKGTGYKREYKILEQKFATLQKSRDSLVIVNTKLKSDFEKLQNSIDQKDKMIFKIKSDLIKVKLDLIRSNMELEQQKKDLDKINQKIKDLKKKPIKREDDDLIRSLREKLKL